MHAIFKQEEIVYAAECFNMDTKGETNKPYPPDIQKILHKHKRVFEPIPLGQPPDRGFEHIIEMEEGAKPVITTPYRHPKKHKDEIECYQGIDSYGTYQAEFKSIRIISCVG
jgi:hypothetical protein